MAYQTQDLQPGDILLMQGRSTSPWWDQALDAGIRWSTDCWAVHAALVGDGVIINPLWHVQADALAIYAQNGFAYRVANASAAHTRRAVQWAMQHVGQRYGLAELLADAGRLDLHLPLGTHWFPHYVTCSGFVAAAYRHAGIALTYAPLPTPADLLYSPLLLGDRP